MDKCDVFTVENKKRGLIYTFSQGFQIDPEVEILIVGDFGSDVKEYIFKPLIQSLRNHNIVLKTWNILRPWQTNTPCCYIVRPIQVPKEIIYKKNNIRLLQLVWYEQQWSKKKKLEIIRQQTRKFKVIVG